ncbi:MAG: type II secretion system F family protein [Candidatus Margulisbacteria bacterium]|nr:type II secretion system F family protein [Candidatus Margulisiibacteriota bacterium]
MLLTAGVPLLEALQIVNNISSTNKYESLINEIADGQSLAQAMNGSFPQMVISTAQGAEKSGSLAEALENLSKYYEHQAEVEDKIKSALVYPGFILALCFLSMFVLLVFVLPGFKSLFADMGAELPLLTKLIIAFGDVFSRFWSLFFIAVVSVYFLIVFYKRTHKGGLQVDQILLKIGFIRKQQVINAFRSLGSLLKGGVPIIEALNTAASSSTNQAFKNIFFHIKAEIENGNSLSDVLKRQPVFPKESFQMISVGENSGRLAEMLLSICDYYERERQVALKRFTALLEPCLTLFVGLVVGFIAVSMFLPMMNVISQLQ